MKVLFVQVEGVQRQVTDGLGFPVNTSPLVQTPSSVSSSRLPDPQMYLNGEQLLQSQSGPAHTDGQLRAEDVVV